jgi:hypothetical protein
MPTEKQNQEFITGTIAVLRKRGASDREIASALVHGLAELSIANAREGAWDPKADLARVACHELLDLVEAEDMGGCHLCCS